MATDNCKTDISLTPKYNIVINNPLIPTGGGSCSVVNEDYVSINAATTLINGLTYLTGITIAPVTSLLSGILKYGPTITLVSPSGINYILNHTSNGVYTSVGNIFINESGTWTVQLRCFEYLLLDNVTVCTNDLNPTLTFTVSETGPQALFTVAPNAADPNTYEFDANGSVNNYPGGTTASLLYSWDFGDGTTTGPIIGDITPNHTYAVNGTYTITLTVQDEAGLTDTYTQTITISVAPTIDVSPTVTCSLVTDLITYAIDNSQYTLFDGLTDATQVEWSFYSALTNTVITTAGFGNRTAGITGHSAYFTGTYENPTFDIDAFLNQYGVVGTAGVYLRVRIADSTNAISDYFQLPTVFVPDVSFTITANTATSGEYDFDASGAILPSADTIADYTYEWDFGNGDTATNVGVATQNYTYPAAGTYTVTLRMVNDCPGRSSSASLTVGVLPPVAVLVANPNVIAGTPATLDSVIDGSGSTSGIVGQTNADLLYHYDFGDGSDSGVPTLGLINTTHVYAMNGTYTVTLTVTDTDGRTSTATDTLTFTELPVGVQNALTVQNNSPSYIQGDSTPSYAYDNDLLVDDSQWTLLDGNDTVLETVGFTPQADAISGTLITGTGELPRINVVEVYQAICAIDDPGPTAVITAVQTGVDSWDLDSSSSSDNGCAGGITDTDWFIYEPDGVTLLATPTTVAHSLTGLDPTMNYPVSLRITTACGIAWDHTILDSETVLAVLAGATTDNTDSFIDVTGSQGDQVRIRVDQGDDASIDYTGTYQNLSLGSIVTLPNFVIADGDRIYVDAQVLSPALTDSFDSLIPDTTLTLVSAVTPTMVTVDISGVFDINTTNRIFTVEYLSDGVLVSSEVLTGSSLYSNFIIDAPAQGWVPGEDFTIRITANDEILTEITPAELTILSVVNTTVEALTIATQNVIPTLANTPDSPTVVVHHAARAYQQLPGISPFSVIGNTVVWNDANINIDLEVGDEVFVEYDTVEFYNGHRTITDYLTATADDVLPDLSQAPALPDEVKFYFNLKPYFAQGATPGFTVAGLGVTVNPANLPFTIPAGATVAAEYVVNEVNSLYRTQVDIMTITTQNVFPMTLSQIPNDVSNVKVKVQHDIHPQGLPAASFQVVGQNLIWIPANAPYNLDVGTIVLVEYTYDEV